MRGRQRSAPASAFGRPGLVVQAAQRAGALVMRQAVLREMSRQALRARRPQTSNSRAKKPRASVSGFDPDFQPRLAAPMAVNFIPAPPHRGAAVANARFTRSYGSVLLGCITRNVVGISVDLGRIH